MILHNSIRVAMVMFHKHIIDSKESERFDVATML